MSLISDLDLIKKVNKQFVISRNLAYEGDITLIMATQSQINNFFALYKTPSYKGDGINIFEELYQIKKYQGIKTFLIEENVFKIFLEKLKNSKYNNFILHFNNNKPLEIRSPSIGLDIHVFQLSPKETLAKEIIKKNMTKVFP